MVTLEYRANLPVLRLLSVRSIIVLNPKRRLVWFIVHINRVYTRVCTRMMLYAAGQTQAHKYIIRVMRT